MVMSEGMSERIVACCRWFHAASEDILNAFKRIQVEGNSSLRRLKIKDVRAELLSSDNAQAEWLVILLHLLWGNFCRDIVVACSTLNGRHDPVIGPKFQWHLASRVVIFCEQLSKDEKMNAMSCEKIKLILAAYTSPIRRITAARNLFAHRSCESLSSFKDAFPAPHPQNYLGLAVCCHRERKMKTSQMESWIKDLQMLANQIEKDLSNG